MQRLFPSFAMHIDRIDAEYEDTLIRLQRLEGAVTSKCHKPFFNNRTFFEGEEKKDQKPNL
jgi:hypothetical protein